MAILRDAVVAAEEIARHVELTQRQVLGTVIEHVGETVVGPEYTGIGSRKLRDQVEHQVAFRAPNAREAHAGEGSQVLSRHGPRPDCLNEIHQLHSVHEESSPHATRWIYSGRSGRAANEEAEQDRSDSEGKPGGDESVEAHVPDDFRH